MNEKETPISNSRYKNAAGIINIVKDGLCHRCGACIGLCPSGVLELDAEGYPIIIENCLECNTCTRICSGAVVDFPEIESWIYGKKYNFDASIGRVKAAYVGHAMDREVR
jgi:ferredoxin-like protein FixX